MMDRCTQVRCRIPYNKRDYLALEISEELHEYLMYEGISGHLHTGVKRRVSTMNDSGEDRRLLSASL